MISGQALQKQSVSWALSYTCVYLLLLCLQRHISPLIIHLPAAALLMLWSMQELFIWSHFKKIKASPANSAAHSQQEGSNDAIIKPYFPVYHQICFWWHHLDIKPAGVSPRCWVFERAKCGGNPWLRHASNLLLCADLIHCHFHYLQHAELLPLTRRWKKLKANITELSRHVNQAHRLKIRTAEPTYINAGEAGRKGSNVRLSQGSH